MHSTRRTQSKWSRTTKKRVALFDNESTSGSDSDLRAFAGMTLPTLQDHLKMAKALPAGGAK